jgi:hypothetical protein
MRQAPQILCTHLDRIQPVVPRTPQGPSSRGEDWRWCYFDEVYV